MNQKAKKLLEDAKAYEWLEKQGRQDHSNGCYYSDPESYGPCNCGYLDDKKYRDHFTDLLMNQ